MVISSTSELPSTLSSSIFDDGKLPKKPAKTAGRIFSENIKQFVNLKYKKIKSEISSGLKFLADKISKIFYRICSLQEEKFESETDIVERIFVEKLIKLVSKGKIKEGQPVVVKLSRRKYNNLPSIEDLHSMESRFNSEIFRSGKGFFLQVPIPPSEKYSYFVIKESGKEEIRILRQYHKQSSTDSKIAEGAIKIIYKLKCLKTDQITDVRAVVKPDMPSMEAAVKVFEEFRNDPNLCTGYYLTYKSKKSKSKKEVFLSPIMDSDLDKLIGKLNRKMQFMAMEQVCLAIKTMHDKGWIHGDVKTNNCLANYDYVAQTIDVKLGDFDLAKKASSCGRIFYEYGEGCFQYMSPELLGDKNCILKFMEKMGLIDYSVTDSSDESIESGPYSSEGIDIEKAKKCDIYSLGIVFWEILERRSSELHLSDSLYATAIGSYDDLHYRGFPKPDRQTDLQALIHKMINPVNPMSRPTIDEVIDELKNIRN